MARGVCALESSYLCCGWWCGGFGAVWSIVSGWNATCIKVLYTTLGSHRLILLCSLLDRPNLHAPLLWMAVSLCPKSFYVKLPTTIMQQWAFIFGTCALTLIGYLTTQSVIFYVDCSHSVFWSASKLVQLKQEHIEAALVLICSWLKLSNLSSIKMFSLFSLVFNGCHSVLNLLVTSHAYSCM